MTESKKKSRTSLLPLYAIVAGVLSGPFSLALTVASHFGFAFAMFGDAIAFVIASSAAIFCAIVAHKFDRIGSKTSMRFAQAGIVLAVLELITLVIFNTYLDRQLM